MRPTRARLIKGRAIQENGKLLRERKRDEAERVGRVRKQGSISSPFWRNSHAETGGHLSSVLLQVLLEPGPRMTPKCTLFGEVAQWRMLRSVGCVLEGIGELQQAPRSTTSSYHDAMLTTDPKAMGLTSHRLKLPKW